MEKDMNFFDLCVLIGRAIGRCCKALWDGILYMIRLTYHYWWVVVPIVILGIAAAFYLSRNENLTYKMNAVANLNGCSIQQFEQVYAPVRAMQMLPEGADITPFVEKRIAYAFETFRVIDCLDDGYADYIDFNKSSSPTDTVEVQMQDQICLQFRIKQRNMDKVPEIEKALMELINSNTALQRAYVVYLQNLQEVAAFNHTQAHKLDSLTTHYYFSNPSPAQPMNYPGNGVNFYGDRQVHLFLNNIYNHQEHMQKFDNRLQLATAPVVLVNHFAADKDPVNGRLKMLAIFLLLGWLGGCALAELIDKRKAIRAWLRGE